MAAVEPQPPGPVCGRSVALAVEAGCCHTELIIEDAARADYARTIFVTSRRLDRGLMERKEESR